MNDVNFLLGNPSWLQAPPRPAVPASGNAPMSGTSTTGMVTPVMPKRSHHLFDGIRFGFTMDSDKNPN